MTTKEFTSYSKVEWTVPAGVETIYVECYGEGGEEGDDFATNSTTGRTIKGDLNTSPGDNLYFEIGKGGTGGNEYEKNAGDGGDAGVIFKNGKTTNDIVAAAAGGGGSANGDYSSGAVTNADYGQGGDNNANGFGAEADEELVSVSVDGGISGNSTSINGYDGKSSRAYSEGVWAYASAGGGGAGKLGGTAGGVKSKVGTYTYQDECVAAAGGAGGGQSYSAELSNLDLIGSANEASVTIDFTSEISWANPNFSVIEDGTDVKISWNSTTLPTGYYQIKRDGTAIDSVSNSTTSYTDTNVPEGTYDYTVVAKNEYTSTATSTITLTQDRSFGKVLKNGSLASNHRIFADVNGTKKEIVKMKYRQNGSLNDIQ